MKFYNIYRRENLCLIKFTSFISSMFPFSLFLILKYHDNNIVLLKHIPLLKNIKLNLIVIFIFLITLISVGYVFYFFKIKIKNDRKNKLNKEKYHLRDIVQEKTNTSSYLLSNVLPVITLDMDNKENIIFMIILIILLAFMYIKNDLYYINPLYDLINIRIYNAECYKLDSEVSSLKLVISLIPLYEFQDNVYEGIDYKDILIIREKK